MRKRISGRIFGRTSAKRRALINGIAESLILHERIRTTEARAKEVRRVAERAVTTGKKGTLAARRQLEAKFTSDVARKVVSELAPRFRSRSGGYTRIIKIGHRAGDRAPLALIEFVEREESK